MEKRVEVRFELELGDRTMQAGAAIPDRPMRAADLLPVILGFSEALCGAVREIVERSGHAVSCRAGCGACCRQLVPISETEALYLAELVDSMPAERRDAIRGRFRQAIESVGPEIMGRLRDTSQLKDLDERRAIGLEYFARGAPCPFLENESCGIYPHRPASCREYLVTSPAENCKAPSADTIARIPMPVRLSEILYCFGDGIGREETRWMPLILALEWAASARDSAQRTFPGPGMFRNLVAQARRAARESTKPAASEGPHSPPAQKT